MLVSLIQVFFGTYKICSNSILFLKSLDLGCCWKKGLLQDLAECNDREEVVVQSIKKIKFSAPPSCSKI
ncbi:hypothetical protein LguiB_026541 [Lonicera macranthoides]